MKTDTPLYPQAYVNITIIRKMFESQQYIELNSSRSSGRMIIPVDYSTFVNNDLISFQIDTSCAVNLKIYGALVSSIENGTL